MELSQYLELNGISQAAFARKIGIDRISMNRIVRKKQRPRILTALKISKETYGKVTFEELSDIKLQEKGKKKQSSTAKDRNNKLKLGKGKKTIP